jgi:excisionase family DNA binding protein
MAAQTSETQASWIRIGELRRRLGVHPITLWRWVKRGEFPAPRHLGNTRARFWSRAEVEAWEAQRLAPPAGGVRP